MATGMLTLIDTAPQCQTFRDQLEAAAKAPADQQLPLEPQRDRGESQRSGLREEVAGYEAMPSRSSPSRRGRTDDRSAPSGRSDVHRERERPGFRAAQGANAHDLP